MNGDRKKMTGSISLFIVLIIIFLSSSLSSFERGNPLLNPSIPLVVCEAIFLVLECFCLPIRRLLGRLESWVFSDGGESISVHLLDIFGANFISKIRGELLLESKGGGGCELRGASARAGISVHSQDTYRSSSSSSSDSMYSATCPP